MAVKITLGDLLHNCAEKFAGRPFVTMAETGKTISYGEFEALTNRLAHGLRDRFPDPLDYVAIILENSVEYLATLICIEEDQRGRGLDQPGDVWCTDGADDRSDRSPGPGHIRCSLGGAGSSARRDPAFAHAGDA